MIVVHHLNASRSTRVLWLLEELAVPYEMVNYQRGADHLAPQALKDIHPLGKSPVITDNGKVIAESGAILDYLARKYGGGRLAVPDTSPDFADYLYWLHFAEGSGMPPMITKMYLSVTGEAAGELKTRMDDLIERHNALIESALAGRDFFVGANLTAADINMEMVLARAAGGRQKDKYPNIARVVGQWQARPAYHKARALG